MHNAKNHNTNIISMLRLYDDKSMLVNRPYGHFRKRPIQNVPDQSKSMTINKSSCLIDRKNSHLTQHFRLPDTAVLFFFTIKTLYKSMPKTNIINIPFSLIKAPVSF